MTAPHMQIHEHLYALGQTVGAYEGVTTSLKDSTLYVALITGGRAERVTCAPRPDDGNRLYFWDSLREPVAPVGSPDAPLEVVRRLRERA